jgi:hypothetical protein
MRVFSVLAEVDVRITDNGGRAKELGSWHKQIAKRIEHRKA